jgi:flagellin-specific chaperone FliS
MSNYQQAAQTYRMNQVSSASPLDLLIMGYDAALASAGQGDLERFTRAITILRDALDFSYDADIAMGFFRLYQYCADLARKGEFDEAAAIVREMRDSWDQVRKQYQMPQPAAVPAGYKPATSASMGQGLPVNNFMMAG